MFGYDNDIFRKIEVLDALLPNPENSLVPNRTSCKHVASRRGDSSMLPSSTKLLDGGSFMFFTQSS